MIKRLLIRPSSDIQSVIVQIEFENLTQPIENFGFTLSRAESENGPWYNVDSVFGSTVLVDRTVEYILRPGNTLFYKVSARDQNGSVVSEAVEHFRAGPKDRFALTIEHNYQRYLDVEDYNEYLLIKRSKTSGYCSCFDDVRMESSDPKCPLCGGTGNVDGYTPLLEIKINILNPISNEALVKEMFGEVTLDTSAVRAWTTGQFKVSTEDILVNLYTNEAFEVSQVSYSKRHNYIIRQAIVMSKLAQGHALYQIAAVKTKVSQARTALSEKYTDIDGWAHVPIDSVSE